MDSKTTKCCGEGSPGISREKTSNYKASDKISSNTNQQAKRQDTK